MRAKPLESKNSSKLIGRIRTIFREWCASLSIDEIVSNKDLIAEIEKMERLLSGRVSV